MTLRSFITSVTALVTLSTSAMSFDYPKNTLIYEGAVGTTKVKITGSARPFARKAHKTTELRNVGTDGKEESKSATVDGRRVVGTDMTLPEDGLPQLSNLTVWFGDIKVSVPDKHLHHVFLPWLQPATFTSETIDTLVAFSADGKAVYLSLAVGDGGGAGTYGWIIRSDGTVSSAPIQRPEP